jgi:hypothetical protein
MTLFLQALCSMRSACLRHSERNGPIPKAVLHGQRLEGCSKTESTGRDRSCLHCGQLRVRLVSKASPLSAALFCDYVFA